MVLLSTPGGRVEIGLPCITSQAGGPLKIVGEWILGCPDYIIYRGSTQTLRSTTEYLRKYKAALKQVQIITLRSTMQPIRKCKKA